MVKKSLEMVKGVSSAEVSVGSATVSYDESVAKKADLEAAITRFGYKILEVLALFIGLPLFLLWSGITEAAKKAPPFALKDIDGNTVSLSDFQNRVVIIDFWATWCHACEDSSPELDDVYRKFKDRGVMLLGISLDEGSDAVDKVRAFKDRLNLSYPMLMGDRKLARAYAILGIPATFILNKNHIIVRRFDGAVISLGDLVSSELEKALKTGMKTSMR
jgi:peroxiredoxin